ncbi:diguanylate cyclase (GGDEF) domain-containing protein [Paucidesulfovibrio gracilis DSM 16080]|uniref:diguanylate cyclase n=1 Tax=Paucidesulfovibrio gracilis DSM 16080 TaxID=1121449 RepID=A0A1T4WM42_9BACT|nr:GGDEF domain-containing protein [Paucidesulfovibrio gracilis]SKA78430.1 diguanylate cyclase (GGDEF) domain-containing protein [Paucidesulfovibrio gracilis DSM 16080]
MPMPENKKHPEPLSSERPNVTETALEQELISELSRLRDEICALSHVPCERMDPRTNLGVFRLFNGISLQQWRSVAQRLEARGWLSLPMDRDVYPHLTILQESLEELTYQTEHDPLTGIANRRAFDRVLDLELERAQRAESTISLAVLDLDDFKQINDRHGHAAGDAVLVHLARILANNKRRYDLAARIGGEEFALLLPGIGQVKSARVVDRIRENLAAHPFQSKDGDSFRVTCSAGVASFRGTTEISPTDFYSLADKALYQAKSLGKNRTDLAPMPDVERAARPSLVRASEKRFLFTGKP